MDAFERPRQGRRIGRGHGRVHRGDERFVRRRQLGATRGFLDPSVQFERGDEVLVAEFAAQHGIVDAVAHPFAPPHAFA